MAKHSFRFQIYRELLARKQEILAKAEKRGKQIGLQKELAGKISLSGAKSSCPSLLRRDIMDAMNQSSRQVMDLAKIPDQIRELVKGYYGDQYDAVPVNTCESGLWLAYDVLVTPPAMGKGTTYRTRYIAPYEKRIEHHLAYGRPFPPKYKDIFADRGVTSGELGILGRRQHNLDVILVPLEGSQYINHGIKYFPSPILTRVDPEASIARFEKIAERHAETLSSIVSLAYDTPGYGYGAKDNDNTPRLQYFFGKLATSYNIPYIADNAQGIPFVGTDPRKTGADLMIYSMDKVAGAPISGLIIGKEDLIVPLRRALGFHSERWGSISSYGKASYVIFDAGRESLAGLIAALKAILDNPLMIQKTVDQVYDIVVKEVESLPSPLRTKLIISKSYNSAWVEINYAQTWDDGHIGLPIFTQEDRCSGTNLLMACLAQMGILPTSIDDGNIEISPGVGTCDENGNLISERMELAVRGLVQSMEILWEYAGFS